MIEACEEIVTTAQPAEDHFKEYGRLLKIAIYELDWRLNNVSPAQIAIIRRSK